MPHRFGQDVLADGRWLTFLGTHSLNHSQRRALLRRGFTPTQGFPSAVMGKSLASPEPGVTQANSGPEIRAAQDTLLSLLAKARADVTPVFYPWAEQIHLLSIADADYPELLARCDDAPPALFACGDIGLLNMPCVAVVGTRQPSADGRRAAYQLGRVLAQAGVVVVSGLARGIDSAVHTGALDGGGRTIAVMATGMDRVYPRANTALARRIGADGLLLSEFLPGCDAQRWHFPRRNRSISGLSLGTVVVEAGQPSGSLITANAAVEQGREVFAYPWSAFHRGGAGCLRLLRDGAQLVTCAADIMAGLGPGLGSLVASEPEPSNDEPALDTRETAVLACVGDGEVSLEQLLHETGFELRSLRALLGTMEVRGLVRSSLLGYRACSP